MKCDTDRQLVNYYIFKAIEWQQSLYLSLPTWKLCFTKSGSFIFPLFFLLTDFLFLSTTLFSQTFLCFPFANIRTHYCGSFHMNNWCDVSYPIIRLFNRKPDVRLLNKTVNYTLQLNEEAPWENKCFTSILWFYRQHSDSCDINRCFCESWIALNIATTSFYIKCHE